MENTTTIEEKHVETRSPRRNYTWRIGVPERILSHLSKKKSPSGLKYSIFMVHNYLYGRNKVVDDNIRLAHLKVLEEDAPLEEARKLLDRAEQLLTS